MEVQAENRKLQDELKRSTTANDTKDFLVRNLKRDVGELSEMNSALEAENKKLADTTSEQQGSLRSLHEQQQPRPSVLYVTGGGTQLVPWLLCVPGASRTVLEVQVPYAQRSFESPKRAPLPGPKILARPSPCSTAPGSAAAASTTGPRSWPRRRGCTRPPSPRRRLRPRS